MERCVRQAGRIIQTMLMVKYLRPEQRRMVVPSHPPCGATIVIQFCDVTGDGDGINFNPKEN